jgi:small-conductance mechanosensitive channel
VTFAIFIACANVLGKWYGCNVTDVFWKLHFTSAAVFLILLMASYMLTTPYHSCWRFLNVSDKDAFTIYRKFIRIVIISFLAMIIAPFLSEFGSLLSGALAIYYFAEMAIARKLIEKALNMKKPSKNFFSFKLVAHINSKVAFLCLMGMSWIIFTNYHSSNSSFFENFKNIYIVILEIFFSQTFISKIVSRFVMQLESIEHKTHPSTTTQMREKNLISICNVVVTAFYVSAVWGFWKYHRIGSTDHDLCDKIMMTSAIVFMTIIIHKGFKEFANALLEKAETSIDTKYKTQLQTFLPTISTIFYVILFVSSALLILSNLGFSIAPILAAFTVFSAAIGLAAQEIIQSFLHGIMFLIEKDLYVGAYVSINGMSGVIDKLSTRVLYLRGDDGALYTIPYGTIGAVANHSKDYSYYYGELHIDHTNNIEDVSKILHQVIDEMKKEESYRSTIPGNAEILGLKPFDLSGPKIFWRIKTLPDANGDNVKYEIYNRLYSAYKKHGISMPTINYIINTA